MVAVLPIGVLFYVDPSLRDVRDLALASGVVSHVLTFAAACLLWFHWRMSASATARWLSGGLTAVATQGLVGDVSWLSGGSSGPSGVVAMLLSQMLLISALAGMHVLWHRHGATRDPIVSGIVAAGVVSAAHLGLLALLPSQSLGPVQLAWLAVMAWLVYGLLALLLILDFPEPLWMRARFALALVTLGAAIAGPWPGTSERELVARSALALVAAVLLCGTALRMLRQSIAEQHHAVDDLSAQLALVEGGARHERAARHEIRATIAGMVAASRLVHGEERVSSDQRESLERMLDLEMTRLARLVDDHAPRPPAIVDLDEVLAPVIARQQLAGRAVEWSPAGCSAVGHADAVAEVVSILLENAAQHAASCVVQVVVRPVGQQIEIAVTDLGPGVAVEVSGDLFDWGRRGPDSLGQGIGLAAARRLMREQHGELAHVTSAHGGATFVVSLPAARSEGVEDPLPRPPVLLPAPEPVVLEQPSRTRAGDSGRAVTGHVA